MKRVKKVLMPVCRTGFLAQNAARPKSQKLSTVFTCSAYPNENQQCMFSDEFVDVKCTQAYSHAYIRTLMFNDEDERI